MARHRDILCAMARLANEVQLAPGRSVTPDFAAHASRLLTAPGQPHKIYDSEPCPLCRSRRPRTAARSRPSPDSGVSERAPS
jgi:hypothetical protein